MLMFFLSVEQRTKICFKHMVETTVCTVFRNFTNITKIIRSIFLSKLKNEFEIDLFVPFIFTYDLTALTILINGFLFIKLYFASSIISSAKIAIFNFSYIFVLVITMC